MEFLQGHNRPDLLVFDHEHGYFFFVEVKRERDRLKEHQITAFNAIEEKFDCSVFVVDLKAL